jgi:hypothetical protein
MYLLLSIFMGAISALAAILIHQSLQPWGLIIGLLLTFSAIWFVGRETGKKSYKALASVAWFGVIVRAGSYGVGHELLILGDGVGTGLLFLGLATVVLATIKKI